jgi:hypothetical protein
MAGPVGWMVASDRSRNLDVEVINTGHYIIGGGPDEWGQLVESL